MSIGGGLSRAVERAVAVDADALQIFVKSARQWKPRPLDPEETAAFREAVAARDLQGHLLAHATYLINVASPDDQIWKRSVDALAVELDRCAALAVPMLVLHPGSHVGSGEEAGLKRAARAMDRVLESRDDDVRILLEITAGQGTNLGSRFEQIAAILSDAGTDEKLGVCFDTCHALAAGYEFRDARSYRKMKREFDSIIGLERLCAFHLNDSKFGLGSRRDRHEHIGRGEVGLEAFRLILNDRKFRDVPMVLETPKGEDLEEDRMNLAVLKGMIA